jgi:hypothetical protein
MSPLIVSFPRSEPIRLPESVPSCLVTLQQRAADGVLEGPACGGCGAATMRLHLYDERLHPLCDSCGHAGRLDRVRCPGCKPPRPAPLVVSVENATATLALGAELREER